MTYRQLIGTSYEYYVLEHIRKDYEKVWHWKDFPEKLMYELNLIKDYDKFKKYRCDIGADLVAFKDNKYYFIQCKNFKETIYIDTLAGFYYLLYENNLNGVLYYSGKLSERLIDLSTGKIPFINLPFNNENIIFKEILTNIIPRDYQLEAYNKLKNLDNAILSLPCSMGKTFISSMLGKDYDNIIILSPTRALAHQTLEKFKEYLDKTYNYILLSIDGKRNIDEINKILKKKNVISSTYDSCDLVNLIISKFKNTYIIIDEFHNLSENNISKESNEINKLLKYKTNKLFVSATPIKDFMKLTETNIYTYKWNDAIKNKYICDFNIYLPDLSRELIKSLELITTNYNEIELKLIKKAYNLIKSMLFNGDKKCICYLTTIDKANIFNNILTLIAKAFNIEIEREQIDCNTKRLKRNEIIDKFKNSTKLFILLNIHVLDEGIDIPECDSVYITQPNNNIINIVQRMCRANRIYINKTQCNIYLWCSEKKTNNILNYIFDKMNENIQNKIYKISQHNSFEKVNIIKNENKKISNSNIFLDDSDNINDFFKKIKFGKELNFDVKDFNILKYIIDKDYIERYNEFLIDSEVLRKWLQINIKRSLNDTIKRTYKKNIDYKIEKIKKSEGSGGHNLEVITLTPEASKKICLSTNSKMGSQIQQYFLDLEVALYKYKNYIIDGMNKKIKQLENNQKPKINTNKKIIYVFRALNTDLTLYRIGKTINSKTRFSKHNSPMANDLEVLFQYETDNIDQVESCIKIYMKKAQYRKYKEVYQVDLNIIKKTIKKCDVEINEINKEIDRKNKKQKGGNLLNKIDDNQILYLLIPML
jgi:superfamily II DNA or RNA helicase